MALQTFTAGQVLTAAQVTALQANDYNQTVSTKTASYVLVAADKGTRVEMNSGSATTITVNTSLFNAGDTLFIQNRGAGVCTITAGTATVSTAGSLALAQYQGGTLYFISTGVAIFFLVGSSGVAALVDADISGTTGSPTTATYTESSINYKTYAFTGSGSITFNKAGLIDVLVVAAGGSQRATQFGGGAGGLLTQNNFYVPVGAVTVTVGASVSSGRGNDSQFLNLTCAGGGNGGTAGVDVGSVGGSGGGGAGAQVACRILGQGNIGANNGTNGAGGGAGGAGVSATGGAGVATTIRAGTSVTYATGGSNSGGAGAANTGNGASGTSANTASGSGIVVVRVRA